MATRTNSTPRTRAPRKGTAAPAPQAAPESTPEPAPLTLATLADAIGAATDAAGVVSVLREASDIGPPAERRNAASSLTVAVAIGAHAADDAVVAAWDTFRAGKTLDDPMESVRGALSALFAAAVSIVLDAPEPAVAAAYWAALTPESDHDAARAARVRGQAQRRSSGGGSGERAAVNVGRRMPQGVFTYQGWTLTVDGAGAGTLTTPDGAVHAGEGTDQAPETFDSPSRPACIAAGVATGRNGWECWTTDTGESMSTVEVSA